MQELYDVGGGEARSVDMYVRVCVRLIEITHTERHEILSLSTHSIVPLFLYIDKHEVSVFVLPDNSLERVWHRGTHTRHEIPTYLCLKMKRE